MSTVVKNVSGRVPRNIGTIIPWIAVCLVGVTGACLAQTPPTRCRYANVATLPITFAAPQPIVDGAINGVSTKILLDTGASKTWLTRERAERMALPLRHSNRSALGVGGESVTYTTRIDEMSIGAVRGNGLRLTVMWDVRPNAPFGAVAGADFLFQSDIEIALAARQLKFFRPIDCDNAFLAYWDVNASVVEFNVPSTADGRPFFTVVVNGRDMRAIVDSGAERSIIDLDAAEGAGVTPQSPGAIRVPAIAGVGRHETDAWTASFQIFVIGNETIKNPRIAIASVWGAALSDSNKIKTAELLREQPEVLLGADFLRAHRVLFAMSQRRLYLSYVGGEVFEGEPRSARPNVDTNAR